MSPIYKIAHLACIALLFAVQCFCFYRQHRKKTEPPSPIRAFSSPKKRPKHPKINPGMPISTRLSLDVEDRGLEDFFQISPPKKTINLQVVTEMDDDPNSPHLMTTDRKRQEYSTKNDQQVQLGTTRSNAREIKASSLFEKDADRLNTEGALGESQETHQKSQFNGNQFILEITSRVIVADAALGWFLQLPIHYTLSCLACLFAAQGFRLVQLGKKQDQVIEIQLSALLAVATLLHMEVELVWTACIGGVILVQLFFDCLFQYLRANYRSLLRIIN